MASSDTIVAIATASGRGGIGVVRVSGNQVPGIAQHLLRLQPKVRYAHYGPFYSPTNHVIDQGIALYFATPHSFTGEDVLELQAHGGPVILDQLVQAIIDTGLARIARPGEFTERAFLNDKIDLAQAEAIADLINASSEQAAKSAVASMQGEFSRKINELLDSVIHLRMYVEAAIDFPEEEIDFLKDEKVTEQLRHLILQIDEILAQAKQGALLQEGMTLVIAGKPNAGKSSLLNALAGRESAIVTDIAGTTRDILREDILIEGVPLHIVDTAGLRHSDDVVEQEGVKRARAAMQQADCILLVVDIQQEQERDATILELQSEVPNNIPVTVILNKCDTIGQEPKLTKVGQLECLVMSAKHLQGIEMLRTHLLETVGYDQTIEGRFITRRRHVVALQQAQQSIFTGQKQLMEHQAGELLAEDLRQAQHHLSEITGAFTSDDLLGKIFSEFCIGK